MKSKNYNIVLIGYRGTGKSTISRKLHQMIPYYKLLSSDKLIEEKIDIPILEYFQENTWDDFRLIEKQVFEEIGNTKKIIIDCGGGVIETKENRDFLKKRHNLVFWIETDIEIVIKRITNSKVTRPRLIKDVPIEEEVRSILSRRNPIYEEYSIMKIDATHMHPVDTAKKILDYYENFKKM